MSFYILRRDNLNVVVVRCLDALGVELVVHAALRLFGAFVPEHHIDVPGHGLTELVGLNGCVQVEPDGRLGVSDGGGELLALIDEIEHEAQHIVVLVELSDVHLLCHILGVAVGFAAEVGLDSRQAVLHIREAVCRPGKQGAEKILVAKRFL